MPTEAGGCVLLCACAECEQRGGSSVSRYQRVPGQVRPGDEVRRRRRRPSRPSTHRADPRQGRQRRHTQRQQVAHTHTGPTVTFPAARLRY